MKNLYYISVLLFILIGCGSRNTSRQVVVEEEPPYGDWEIGEYVDDFDEPTGEKYVRQIIRGDFSNSATSSSPLRVYIYLYKYTYLSGKTSVDGKILFDEYLDGTEDFHIWEDASPAKYGTKIVDKPNRKAYYYEERRGFRDIDTDKWYNWIGILRDSTSVYNFTIKGEYKDEYRFSVNSEKLNKALKDAGIIEEEITETP